MMMEVQRGSARLHSLKNFFLWGGWGVPENNSVVRLDTRISTAFYLFLGVCA
jgi:hypothetical protein